MPQERNSPSRCPAGCGSGGWTPMSTSAEKGSRWGRPLPGPLGRPLLRRVVVHTGAIQKRTRQAALATARQCFRTLRHRCDEEGYQDILLCPETMGKINQLGDLEEVLTLCTEAEGLLPCVDFGHLYARSLGALDGPEAVERMLDQMVRELGVARASQFHSHFSKIAYTPRGGEARHLTFDQPDFGPDPAPLCEALARRGWSPRVICESAGTQDVDALWMKGAYLRALGETAEG